MELINTHCHSKYCGHGEGEIDEYVRAALDAGIKTLAFTEHFPLSDAFDPAGYLSVPADRMNAYIADVRAAQERHPQIEILLGIELDYLGEYEDRRLQDAGLGQFDLILESVHFVDKWPFDDPAQRDVWEKEGQPDRIWRRYIDLWCQLASSQEPGIRIMSHPDLAKKFGYMPSFSLEPEYRKMAEAAKSGGKLIEVNTSGAYYLCKEQFPSSGLLEQFCRAGVPCTVGTDAHVPGNVARDIDLAYRLMESAGYKEVTVPSSGGTFRKLKIQ